MLSVGSRFSLHKDSSGSLTLKTSPRRRVLFLGLAILLFVAFLVGIDPDRGVPREQLGGTVFYFAVLLVCFGVSGWDTRVVFRRGDSVERRTRFVGIPLRASVVAASDVCAVVLQSVVLSKKRDLPRRDGGLFTGSMSRGVEIAKLVVETRDRSLFLEDSRSSGELSMIGTRIAEHLGVPFRTDTV
ncbi:MAG: DUF1109 domain-containing protein [Spirochaetaceae bacterium]|nr:MAG: DUF1109 domain-containing protein [Spirochaetaceae bacterium]